MLGDVLKKRLSDLSEAESKKSSKKALWMIIRDIAADEIRELGEPVDSDILVPVYYNIIKENEHYLPDYYRERLQCNNQERYRVIIRNVFTSNAFNPDGLANQKGILARKEINERKKGERIVFERGEVYDN